jgi:hypothetical protein
MRMNSVKTDDIFSGPFYYSDRLLDARITISAINQGDAGQ